MNCCSLKNEPWLLLNKLPHPHPLICVVNPERDRHFLN